MFIVVWAETLKVASSSSFGFSQHESPQQIFHIYLVLTSVSSSVTSTSSTSSFTTSINLLFGLPRFLFPDYSILSILLPIYQSYFLSTCPFHLSLEVARREILIREESIMRDVIQGTIDGKWPKQRKRSGMMNMI